MPHPQRNTLKQRLLPFTAAVVTLGAIVGFSQLSANLTSGATAKPTHERSLRAASGPDGTIVVVNKRPGATKDYWTKAKMNAAKEVTSVRTDISGSSYGTSGLDFTRSRIAPRNANIAVPYRTTGKLFFTEPGVGNFQCSASVIDWRVVITAAHCVHSGNAPFTNFTFIPGYDGAQSTLAKQRPFGTWTWSSIHVPTNWDTTNGALPNATDFAAIVFADQTISGTPTRLAKVAGQYGFSLNHLFDNHVTILGYPCNFDSCNIMQRVDSSDHRLPPGFDASANAYEYGSDMTGGSSGGPWLENFGTGAAPQGSWNLRNRVVAVTSYGYIGGGTTLLVQGASQLDSRWTTIYNSACALAAGNC